jgi:hypothetical protein
VILLVAQGYKDGKLEIPPLQPGEERTLEVKLRK